MPTAITAEESLRVIAEMPDAALKTPVDLREAAADFERQAERKDRLTASRSDGNRRAARQMAAKRDADQLRLHAQVARSAAEEIEKRKSDTVGDATRHSFLRFLAGRRRG